MTRINPLGLAFVLLLPVLFAADAGAWNDETHLAVARAAGYRKWYTAVGADMARVKAGDREGHNHYSNNPPGAVVTPRMVLAQAEKYNTIEPHGHLYGAIVASLRHYLSEMRAGNYAEYHMGFCAHYVGDLSMPLHNIEYDAFNRKWHSKMDGIVTSPVENVPGEIDVYEISIQSEADLAFHIARIANISISLAEQLERENRMITRREAWRQISHSASLLHAILKYRETALQEMISAP